MLPIHSDTSRAYWRVVILRSGPRRPVNKNSPGLVGGLQTIINGLPGLFAQFKPGRPSSFLLPDGRAVGRTSTGGDIFDPKSNDITTTKLAIDCQVAHG
jgi:hypothetical protein